LDNGLRVIAAERPGTGLVELRLVLAHGAAAESPAESGLTSVAMRLLGRVRFGTDSIADEMARHGATFRSAAELDGGVIEISALRDNLADALAQLGRVVTRPEFDELDLARARSECIAMINHEIARPFDLATRLLPRLVFPDGHPCGRPFGGLGNEQAIGRATAEQVRNYHSRALRSDAATLIAVGPFETPAMIALVEKSFRGWQPSSEVSTTPLLTPVESRRSGELAVIDRAGRAQAAIFAALPLPARRDPEVDALVIADAILGGTFNSRLNQMFREQSGWSYGAYSRMLHARRGGLWIVHTFVRPDRVAAAINEIRRQLPDGARGRAIDEAEFMRARDYLIASLPARRETNSQIAEALQASVLHDLADGYHADFARRLAHLRLPDLRRVCTRRIDHASIAWLVIGEAASLVGEIASAGCDVPRTIDDAGL